MLINLEPDVVGFGMGKMEAASLVAESVSAFEYVHECQFSNKKFDPFCSPCKPMENSPSNDHLITLFTL